ncbi:unnamed protein product, partial [Soboliphyme baturini]|uniref:Type III secretion protein n=1 Tax=Soboliphyme baturini TaxID=241478 RepID=A0A183IAJ2_9BILA
MFLTAFKMIQTYFHAVSSPVDISSEKTRKGD